MNIHEFSERYKISLAKCRLILKENPHWFDGSASTQRSVTISCKV